MLLALRSLWEQIAGPPALSGGGPRWYSPQVNLAEFYKPKSAYKKPATKTGAALALFVGGQIDLATFAALLAATE